MSLWSNVLRYVGSVRPIVVRLWADAGWLGTSRLRKGGEFTQGSSRFKNLRLCSKHWVEWNRRSRNQILSSIIITVVKSVGLS